VLRRLPGLNLRLAADLRAQGLSLPGGGPIRALYYISPQIWAWKAQRRFTMARDLDALAVIFPFEVECYSDTHLPVEFVGHPFVAEDTRRRCITIRRVRAPAARQPAAGGTADFPALLGGFRALGERDAVVLYPATTSAPRCRPRRRRPMCGCNAWAHP